MPMFTAIALDRLLEPGHSKSMLTARSVPDPRLERRSNTPNSRYDDKRYSASSSKLEREISAPTIELGQRNGNRTIPIDRKHHWTGISPALYATPKSTPLPDSPSSYPPSPYIINHKRRGPQLLKSMSQDDVAIHQCAINEKEKVGSAIDAEKHAVTADVDDSSIPKEDNSLKDDNLSVTANKPSKEDPMSDTCAGENSVQNLDNSSAAENGTRKSVAFDLQQNSVVGNFFDPQDSMSFKSNADSENNGGPERSLNSSAQTAEFYDAWEEISSDNEPQPISHDIEAELREIRFSLLMEIEKQKQAEEALNHMQMQWQRIHEQLLPIGLTLPAAPVTVGENQQLDDAVKNMIQQLYIARFVSNSIGRGMAKAEAEEEMESQIELKNFEIARLWDKLHYYEAVNREMSQRNQEAVETARHLRQRRKRRLRWIWGSVAASITIGSAVLAWSYISAGRGSSYSNQSETSESGHVTKRLASIQ